MKGKRFLLLVLSIFISFAIGGKAPIPTSRLDTMAIVGQTAKAFENVIAQSATIQENPSAVFASALSGYESQFPDWLDVTAINVTVKEAIELADDKVNIFFTILGKIPFANVG